MPDKRKANDKSSDESGKDKPDKETRAKNQAGKKPALEGSVPEQKVGDTPTPPWEMPSPEQKAAAASAGAGPAAPAAEAPPVALMAPATDDDAPSFAGRLNEALPSPMSGPASA